MDLFAPVKFNFFKYYFKFCKSRKTEKNDKKSDEYAINSLSRSEVLFYKGLKIFEEDICVENILRSIHKL